MTNVFATVSVRFLRVPRLKTAGRLGALTIALALPASAFAQGQGPGIYRQHGMGNTGAAPAPLTTQQPSTTGQPSATGKPSAAIPTANAAASASTQPVSQLQEPPKQAVIETQSNSLTIRADNASLTQTLQRIADKTGMHLEGVTGDQRVFGNFGPGAPRDVLSTLLTGTGYNILMIGALDNGVPRQLILSQKKTDQSSGQAANAPRQQQAINTPDEDATDPPPDDQPPAVPPPHGGPDGTGPGIRTPQQMLQQMQQMRQQNEQQQQPGGSPPQ